MSKNGVLTGLYFSPEQATGHVANEADAEVAAAIGDGVMAAGEDTTRMVFNPMGCMNETAIAKAIFEGTDWKKAEPAQGANGEYLTTRAHNITFKPGDGYRYQINVSAIRRTDKNANVDQLTRAERKAIDTLSAGLSPDDKAHLEKLLTVKKQGTTSKAIDRIANLR